MRSALNRRSLLLAPSSVIFVVLFLLPVSYFFVLSFWRVRAYQLRADLTLDQYVTVVTDYTQSIAYTFGIALAIAVVTTTVAFAYAYFCRFKAGRFGFVFLFVAIITLFGGYLTKIYMWKTILGSSGILNSAFMILDLIDSPITAFLFSPIAVIITLTHYTLPLAVLPIYGSLRGITDTPLQAARDLGASQTRVFFSIVLPQTRVGLITSFSLTFLFAAGDYVTPLLVGGPHTSMIGLFIQSQFGHRLNVPLGSAMSFSVVVCCLLVITVVALLINRVTRPR
ncbi:MAG: ABC transporter permease [Alphaproteobacteria bacterium]|nr:ABC transporter permease [Alphaproteobacteria bacterium]